MRKFLLLCLISGCTQFPELDDTIDETILDEPYVDFTPFGDLQEGPPPASPEEADALSDRVSALRKKAKALRKRKVTDPELTARIRDRNR